MHWNYRENYNILGPQAVSFVERLSLSQSVHYQRFYCINSFSAKMRFSLMHGSHVFRCQFYIIGAYMTLYYTVLHNYDALAV